MTDLQEIEMPKNGAILTVQVQRQIPCLWVLVETNGEGNEKRFIRIVGTGHSVPGIILKYIGTFQLAEGDFIGHVFEEKRENARDSRAE